MRVNKWLLPILALVLILGTVGIAQAAGLWVVSGREMVNLAQLTRGDDVKGWMTLQQVSDGVGLPVATIVGLIDPAGAADLPPQTALRDIEARVDGFDLPAFREQLRALLGATPGTSGASPSPEASGR